MTSPHFSPPLVARRREVVPCLYFATTPNIACSYRQPMFGGCAGIVDTMSSALTEPNAGSVRHSVVAVDKVVRNAG